MKSWLLKNPLLSFFLMAFGLSWTLWLPVILSGPRMPPWAIPFHILGGLGPFAASAIMLSLSGDEGETQAFKKSLLGWRLPLRWYALALTLPLAMVATAYLIFFLLSGSFPGTAGLPSPWLYPALLLYLTTLGGGLEEPGWRGYAYPRLLARYNPLPASLLLGLAWGLWHLPLFLAPGVSQGQLPVGYFLLTGIALSVIFSWWYLATGGSILMAVIFHGGLNAALNYYPFQNGAVEPFLPYAVTAIFTALLLALLSPHLKNRGKEEKGLLNRLKGF